MNMIEISRMYSIYQLLEEKTLFILILKKKCENHGLHLSIAIDRGSLC
jgi:hypothetical protein